MTLAHEYAHVILHAPLWRTDEAPALPGLAMTDTPAGGRHSADWMEWQANYAAGAILMPYRAVADIVAEGENTGYGDADDHDRALIARLTDRCVVSWSAATVRLRQLGVLRRPRSTSRG